MLEVHRWLVLLLSGHLNRMNVSSLAGPGLLLGGGFVVGGCGLAPVTEPGRCDDSKDPEGGVAVPGILAAVGVAMSSIEASTGPNKCWGGTGGWYSN